MIIVLGLLHENRYFPVKHFSGFTIFDITIIVCRYFGV